MHTFCAPDAKSMYFTIENQPVHHKRAIGLDNTRDFAFSTVKHTHFGRFFSSVKHEVLKITGLGVSDPPFFAISSVRNTPPPLCGWLAGWVGLGWAGWLVTSGLLLFYANPLKASQNLFFQIKMVALLLAGLNAFFFHAVIYRKVTTWDSLQIVPFRARLAGCASLTLWTAVLVSGRLQAFNWFN